MLGYVWSLMRPLLFFGVLYLFFTQIVKLGKGVPHYGVYLLTAIVLWNYFVEATRARVTCLRRRARPAAQDALPADGRSRCRCR